MRWNNSFMRRLISLKASAVFLLLLFFIPCEPALADQARAFNNPFLQWNIQSTVIGQTLFAFRSPYTGPNSLLSRDETEITHASLLSLKANLADEVMLDTDLAYVGGQGVGGGNGTGLAGYVNDQVIRISAVGKALYFARFFMRWTKTFSKDNQLVISVGKFAVTDLFDRNRYANSVDAQFLNLGMVNDLAYDFAADTRGYSGGIAVQWIHPDWALRAGSFQMPVTANGLRLSGDFGASRGDQIELEVHPKIFRAQSAIRLLAYQNHAHMGNYNDATDLARQTGTTPSITVVETTGAVKTGFAVNADQALGDGGDTGIFLRYGWNNGQTEAFAYTEADRFISLGLQLSGNHWKLPLDRIGIGIQQSDLSSPHARYLALGGLGFQLGDGQLNYGSERIAEVYYSHGISEHCAVSLDYQYAANPGYNRDRGPVSALALRLHVEH